PSHHRCDPLFSTSSASSIIHHHPSTTVHLSSEIAALQFAAPYSNSINDHQHDHHPRLIIIINIITVAAPYRFPINNSIAAVEHHLIRTTKRAQMFERTLMEVRSNFIVVWANFIQMVRR
ncbi:hypothetical protein SOVF_199150, partial [Spinacia oleracea]